MSTKSTLHTTSCWLQQNNQTTHSGKDTPRCRHDARTEYYKATIQHGLRRFSTFAKASAFTSDRFPVPVVTVMFWTVVRASPRPQTLWMAQRTTATSVTLAALA